MPYDPQAPLSSGTILSAAWLNALAANTEYLYGLMLQANMPFASLGDPDTGTLDVTGWIIRHRMNKLYYRFFAEHTLDAMNIYYDTTQILSGGSGSGGIRTGSVDLTSFAFTVGQWYTVRVHLHHTDSDTGVLRVDYLYEGV